MVEHEGGRWLAGVFVPTDGPHAIHGGSGEGEPDAVESTAPASLLGQDADALQSGEDAAATATNGAAGADGSAAEDANGTDGKAAGLGAPDQYEAFTIPDGLVASDEQLSQFREMAKGLNLSQPNAQKLIEFEAMRMGEMFTAQENAWETQKTQWIEQIRSDPELGGQSMLEKQATAVRAVLRIGGDSLVTALNETGAGNHPELVRAFYRIGLAMTEDHFSGSGEPLEVGGKKTRAQIMYGDQDG